MPSFNIIKEVKATDTFRVEAIKGMFDLQSSHIKENFIGEIPIENENWNIGCIVGNSGTGKTIISRELFADFIFTTQYKNNSVIDDMPDNIDIRTITKVFNSVGFSSPPSWLKPYSVLSEGEKMRVNLASALLSKKDIIVFDEFTSVVDRTVAKIASFAIAKTIRRENKKFIAVSCHFDILDWLEPDWVFNTNVMLFQKKNSKDQKLKLKYTNALGSIGKCLGNIII